MQGEKIENQLARRGLVSQGSGGPPGGVIWMHCAQVDGQIQ